MTPNDFVVRTDPDTGYLRVDHPTRSHRAVRTHRLVDEPPVFPREGRAGTEREAAASAAAALRAARRLEGGMR